MIKWLIKKYLNKILDYKKYQKLSLEHELGYADYLLKEEEKEMVKAHSEIMIDINALNNVLDILK